MAACEMRRIARPTSVVLLCLLVLGGLSGCASNVLYWGPALSTCKGASSAPEFTKGSCRNGAEYDIARKKARRSLSDAVLDEDNGKT